jgi:hypothetical protein
MNRSHSIGLEFSLLITVREMLSQFREDQPGWKFGLVFRWR